MSSDRYLKPQVLKKGITSTDSFKTIEDEIEDVIKRIAGEMLSGDAKVAPFVYKKPPRNARRFFATLTPLFS